MSILRGSYLVAEVTNGTGTIKWRVQCREECTETRQCLRRDAGIAGRVGSILPYTSPQTCSALNGIHSLPRACSGRGKALQSATFSRWCWCGPRCEDWRIGNTTQNTNTTQIQDEAHCIVGIYCDWIIMLFALWVYIVIGHIMPIALWVYIAIGCIMQIPVALALWVYYRLGL